uniref:fimbrial protein n=1 Tax=Entomohabitans teleogrylli TaxID=1384589 RepID=UPI000A8AEF10
MKKRVAPGAVVIGLLMIGAASSVCAANQDTDGLNGGIRATGTLVASPCRLLSESVEQKIDLGSAIAWELELRGSVTTPVPVYIRLDGCPGEYQFMRDDQRMRGTTVLTGQSAVKMTLYGEME